MPKGSKPVEKAKGNYKFSANIRTIVKEKGRTAGRGSKGIFDPNNVDKLVPPGKRK